MRGTSKYIFGYTEAIRAAGADVSTAHYKHHMYLLPIYVRPAETYACESTLRLDLIMASSSSSVWRRYSSRRFGTLV